ncbi:DUF2493 domain-containing protein [Lutibacter sp. HS1-25]|uniref:SLOG family protein n=1 Tax=Lutibacter sp. HS1-25 TaxID=2485000 RepID=UPI00101351CC|nr:SLOG family protein [Lutibacter sp. HS1-25]RXP46200.1 DUF2493 domain-containing protein [Lutibacter sp. HS1-25]
MKIRYNQPLQNQTEIEIVSGAYYKGADKLGEQYAAEKGFHIKQFSADWKRYKRAAGSKRNQQMANYAEALIAFWDGKSRGTKNMIEVAKSYNLKIIVTAFY